MNSTTDMNLTTRVWDKIADAAHTRDVQKRLTPKVEREKIAVPEEVRAALLANKVGASVIAEDKERGRTVLTQNPVTLKGLQPLSKPQRAAIKELRDEVAGEIHQNFLEQGRLEVKRILVDGKSPGAEETVAELDEKISTLSAERKELFQAERALNALMGSGLFDIGVTATGHLGFGIPLLAYGGVELGAGARDLRVDPHMPTAKGMLPFINVEASPDTGIQFKPGKYLDVGQSAERGRYTRFQIPAVGYVGLYRLDSARPGIEAGVLPSFNFFGGGAGIETPLLRPVVRPIMRIQSAVNRAGAHIVKPIMQGIRALKARFQPSTATPG